MSRHVKIAAPVVDWQQVDGQTAKCLSIQERRREYIALRRIAYRKPTLWARVKRWLQSEAF